MDWPGHTKPERLLVPHLIDAKRGEFYTSKWVELDLGRHATVSRYALRHGCDKPIYFMRNWKLLGRQHSHEPWTTIREHHNDMTIGRTYDTRQGGFGVFYFDVPQRGPFRFFKVEAFGPPREWGFSGLCISGIELYGSLSSPTAAAPAGRTLRGLRIESVAQTEVTLAWEQGSAQSFEVQWRKTWGAWQTFTTVRRSRARVSGLDAGGAYSFRVKAMGGEWSQGVSAQLSAPAPTPEPRTGQAPRGLRIESVAQTEATLVWEQGSAQSFEVQWRKTWGAGAWQNFATVRRSRARVSGLDAGSLGPYPPRYSFRVRATGGEWSQEVSAQLSAPTPGALRNSAAQPERDSQPEPGIDAALGGAFNTSGRSNLPPRAEPALERSSGTDECPVCLERARDTAFMPCGHRVCAECARILSQTAWRGSGPRGDSESRCPECRQPFTGTLRLF